MTAFTSLFVYGSARACQLLREVGASDIACGPDIEYGRAIGFYALAAADALGVGVAIVALLRGPRSRPKIPKKQTPSSKGPR